MGAHRIQGLGANTPGRGVYRPFKSAVVLPVTQQVKTRYVAGKADYVYDTGGYIFSPAAGRIVKYEAYDRLSTPRNTMYGDIVFITDSESGDLLELRWFDGQKKHVVFNDKLQRGVTELIPPVKNSLY